MLINFPNNSISSINQFIQNKWNILTPLQKKISIIVSTAFALLSSTILLFKDYKATKKPVINRPFRLPPPPPPSPPLLRPHPKHSPSASSSCASSSSASVASLYSSSSSSSSCGSSSSSSAASLYSPSSSSSPKAKKIDDKERAFKAGDLEIYADPHLVKYQKLSKDLIAELATSVIELPGWNIKNTGMTDLLQHYTFNSELLPTEDLNKFLGVLAIAFKATDNKQIQLALTRPNNSDASKEFLKQSSPSGFPQNTPLALLVKGGNLKGCETILPLYEKNDLLFVTPRGNTVLHLATMTGQLGIVAAIINRAVELDILDDLLAIENNEGKKADDMLTLLFDNKKLFKNFLDVANPYLGGDEINKACCIGINDNVLHLRNQFISQLKKLTPKSIDLPAMDTMNLKTLFTNLKLI